MSLFVVSDLARDDASDDHANAAEIAVGVITLGERQASRERTRIGVLGAAKLHVAIRRAILARDFDHIPSRIDRAVGDDGRLQIEVRERSHEHLQSEARSIRPGAEALNTSIRTNPGNRKGSEFLPFTRLIVCNSHLSQSHWSSYFRVENRSMVGSGFLGTTALMLRHVRQQFSSAPLSAQPYFSRVLEHFGIFCLARVSLQREKSQPLLQPHARLLAVRELDAGGLQGFTKNIQGARVGLAFS
jgi:hypothetical protein